MIAKKRNERKLNLLMENSVLFDTLRIALRGIRCVREDNAYFYSRGISLRPLARRIIVLLPVVLEQVRDFGHERVIGVGIGEERTDREEHFGDGEGRRPLILEDVEADGAIRVDVSMVNFCCKGDLRGLERVVRWEDDVQEEYST